MSTAGETVKKLASLSGGLSRIQQGTCKSVDWGAGRAVVNISGGEVTVPMVGSPPAPGRHVWVQYVGDSPVCLGMVAKPLLGTISGSASAGRINVVADDGETYTLPYLGAAPSNGQRVLIDWDVNGVILAGALSAEPEGSEYEPPATQPPSVSKKTITIYPRASGSYSNSSGQWFDSSVRSDGNARGAYFYGTKVRDSVPSGAEIVKAEFYAAFEMANYTSVSLGVSTLNSKSGPPTISGGTVSIGLSSGWKNVTSLIAGLRGSGRSLATTNAGLSRLARAGSRNAGALRITYEI